MRPDLKPCPFCGSHLMLLGPSRAQHPVAGCILSGREIAAREFREWNKRARAPGGGQLCSCTVEMAECAAFSAGYEAGERDGLAIQEDMVAELEEAFEVNTRYVSETQKDMVRVMAERDHLLASLRQIEAGLAFIAADDTADEARMADRLLTIARAALEGGQLCSCTVEGAEWQPIETAPKDGTRFLGYWTDIHDNGCDSPAKTWFQDGRWHSPWEDASERDAWAPTHWMPLPVQPQGALDRAAGREGGGE